MIICDVPTECRTYASTWCFCFLYTYRFLLLRHRILEGGLIAAAPPCSLMVAACASVHMRSWLRPQGFTGVFKVRLANRIWRNTAAGLTEIRLPAACYSFCVGPLCQGMPPHHQTFPASVIVEAVFLEMMHRLGRQIHVLIEQPSSSWGFKQFYMVDLAKMLGMCPPKFDVR